MYPGTEYVRSTTTSVIVLTTDNERDRLLMERIAGGDNKALATLYDEYASLMFATCCRILSDRREAEDLLHDVFIELWRKAGDYDPARGTVRTWILMRLRSRALDRCKSARISRSVAIDDTTVLQNRVADHRAGESPRPRGDPRRRHGPARHAARGPRAGLLPGIVLVRDRARARCSHRHGQVQGRRRHEPAPTRSLRR